MDSLRLETFGLLTTADVQASLLFETFRISYDIRRSYFGSWISLHRLVSFLEFLASIVTILVSVVYIIDSD